MLGAGNIFISHFLNKFLELNFSLNAWHFVERTVVFLTFDPRNNGLFEVITGVWRVSSAEQIREGTRRNFLWQMEGNAERHHWATVVANSVAPTNNSGVFIGQLKSGAGLFSNIHL